MDTAYTLYGSENSLYSGKARAYLRYKNPDWREEQATIANYRSFIIPRVGFGIIPVLHTREDEVVQDTTDIIDYLEARHPEFSVYPDSPAQQLAGRLLELYGDEWLIIPAMHYRWNFLEQHGDFIYREFGKLGAPDGTEEEQIASGTKLGKPFRGVTPFLGVTEETIPAIEVGYEAMLEQLQALFSRQKYLFGSRPSIGDLGLIGPLYAHTGRDPYPKALMQKKAPAVYQWVERMQRPEPCSGEFAAGDVIENEVKWMLRVQAEDQLPFLQQTAQKTAEWIAQHPDEATLPRHLDMGPFTTHGASGERMLATYSLWMYQRAYDYYHGLNGQDKTAADALLKDVGAYEQLNTELPCRVARKKGQYEVIREGAA